MKIGLSHDLPLYLPKLLNSLPDVEAEFQQPFVLYDVTVNCDSHGSRKLVFEPEKENLAGLRYPVTIDYQAAEPSFRVNRAVCFDSVKLIRKWESLFNEIGVLVVSENYSEVRSMIHPSIAVEQTLSSCSGIQVILGSGYQAKVQLLSAVMRKQPFIVHHFDGVSEILKSLHCLSPWMIPFSTISEALTRLETIKMTMDSGQPALSNDLERARQRCLSERLHYNNAHIWLKALYE